MALPHHDNNGGPSNGAEMRLAGDPTLDGGCLWGEFRQGPERDWKPVAILWPRGWEARFTDRDGAITSELLDPDGNVVAGVGEAVMAEGYWTEHGRRLDRCHVGGDKVVHVGFVNGQSHGAD